MNPAEASLSAAFEPAPREPEWLAQVRAAAYGRFRASGLPNAKDEDWRFTSLARLSSIPFGRAQAADPAAAAFLARASAPEGPSLVFVNGRFATGLSSTMSLPSGAVLSSLAEALRRWPEKVRPHLGRLTKEGAHPFVAANTALFEDGGFLLLPAGAALDRPVSLVFVTDAAAGPAAAHPRTLVVLEEGARASIEEVFTGRGTSLTNGVTELFLGRSARLEHVRIQVEAPEAFHVGVVLAEEGAEAALSAHAFTVGAQLSRSELRARLEGEGARISANGLYMADGSRVADSFSWVEHAAPRCTTTESYKGILDGRARGIFSGRIRVLPGAQKADAHQMSSSLLLSEDAIADAKPQLEIFADDVKCGHGGTVGQLDPEALFYLRSRGVPEAEARGLLIWAFASEMVGLVKSPYLRARAEKLVAARLPAGARMLETVS